MNISSSITNTNHPDQDGHHIALGSALSDLQRDTIFLHQRRQPAIFAQKASVEILFRRTGFPEGVPSLGLLVHPRKDQGPSTVATQPPKFLLMQEVD